MAKLISGTYGEALYEVAREGNQTAQLLGEIRELRKILEENPDFTKLMLHPSVSKPEKLEIAEKVFRGRMSDELVGFVMTVVDKERFSELEDIFDYYIAKVKEAQGIGVAYVTTPERIDVVTQKEVERKLLETTSYREMEMHFQTDPSIIGGIVIRIGDRVADASVRTRINDLTRQLLDIQLG
ncbi:MAG: ATP synthase F1 subunit delta [Lachnospiraceae bacterium]|nr:ATP synthase F1 subunit delta [Lachnospiraceae bacterium]